MVITLHELLVKCDIKDLLFMAEVSDDFSECDFKDYILSHIVYINLVSEKPLFIEGRYDLHGIFEDDIKLLDSQIDLNKTYIYHDIGHNGEWQLNEVDSYNEAISIARYYDTNMFITTVCIVHNGDVITWKHWRD